MSFSCWPSARCPCFGGCRLPHLDVPSFVSAALAQRTACWAAHPPAYRARRYLRASATLSREPLPLSERDDPQLSLSALLLMATSVAACAC